MFRDSNIQLCLYGIGILLPLWCLLDYLKVAGTDPLMGYTMDTVKVLTGALLAFIKADGGYLKPATPIVPASDAGSLSQPEDKGV